MGGKRIAKQEPWKRALGSLCLVAVGAAMMVPLTGSVASAQQSPALPAVTETSAPWGQPLPSVSANDPAMAPIWWQAELPETPPMTDAYFADALFLGDSRTEGFQLYSGLTTGMYYHAVGATVDSVVTRPTQRVPGGKKVPLVEAMAQEHPAKIYVMLGVNELGWPGTDKFHDRYALLIDRLRQDHPGAELVLQSILPVSAKQQAKQTYVNNDRIAAYNQVIRRLAVEKQCWYLDVSTPVTGEDGCLIPELTPDGVHLNGAGCRIWLETLRRHGV